MGRFTAKRVIPVVTGLTLTLLLAACGGGQVTGSNSSGGSTSGGATSAKGTKSFSVAFTSAGVSSAPFLAALDQLRSQGYTIKTPTLAESELVTAGTAKGKFAFGSGAASSVLLANSKGANLKIVVDRVSNEWTLYARKDIKKCSDLGGRRLAIHSPGAVSTAMVKNYVQTNCSGTNPNYVVIAGSSNRLAALLANRIDASPLELSDGVTLEKEAGDRYSLLSSFSQDLPKLHPTPIYVNGDFAQQNPGTVTAVVKAVLKQDRKIAGDPQYLEEIAKKYVPKAVDPKTIDAVAKKYVDLKLFDVNGGLTKSNLEYLARFFGPKGAGVVDQTVPVGEFADLSYLHKALDELGRK
ncbi:MAG: ABC transporter substrate-binding protein [Nocardioidaceae bacterium]